MPIPLPPIEEQYRIATILDKAELLRAKRRTSLTVLHSLTQAMFVDLFGDPVTNPRGWRLGYIGDLLDSATYGTSRKAGPEGGLPVLRMGNVTVTGEIEIEDLKFVDLPPTDIDKHTVRRGDILFNRTNSADLVGKAAVYRFDDVMAYAGYLVRLRCSADTSPEYLGAFLNLPSTKRIFRAMCKSIIGMANINARELQGVPVPIPPSELQHTFETRISKVRSVAARLAVDRTDLDALFGSLRHRAFSGAL
jgi:type I restriction enzyme S subunit